MSNLPFDGIDFGDGTCFQMSPGAALLYAQDINPKSRGYELASAYIEEHASNWRLWFSGFPEDRCKMEEYAYANTFKFENIFKNNVECLKAFCNFTNNNEYALDFFRREIK